MCLVEFIVKYVLFIVNLAFSLLGLAIVGLGIATLVVIKDINDILPIQVLGIAILVLGIVVFFIGFLACCGAIKESQCMLLTYAIAVSILAGLKIWLTVIVFNGLSTIESTVDGWLVNGFNTQGFNAVELTFRCCGINGPSSYNSTLPVSCCNILYNPDMLQQCTLENANPSGCNTLVEDWFSTFGGAVGGMLITIIIIEFVAILFSLFFCNAVRNKRKRNY